MQGDFSASRSRTHAQQWDLLVRLSVSLRGHVEPLNLSSFGPPVNCQLPHIRALPEGTVKSQGRGWQHARRMSRVLWFPPRNGLLADSLLSRSLVATPICRGVVTMLLCDLYPK